MATSQNGYSAFGNYGEAGLVSNPTVPGADVKILGGLRGGAVLTVLLYVAARWNQEIERLVQSGGNWGYSFRNIRGSETSLSNHASGTAIDLMAAHHPLATRTLSAGQLETLRRMNLDLQGVVRFGAFYTGRVDEMHAEINRVIAEVERVAALIRAGKLPNVPRELLTVQGNPGAPVGGGVTPPVVIAPPTPAQPTPTVPAFPLPAGYYYGPKDGPRESISGMVASDAPYVEGLKAAQRRLMLHLPGCLTRYGADGQYGRTAGGETYDAVRLFQRISGRGLTVDGLIGPATWRELHL